MKNKVILLTIVGLSIVACGPLEMQDRSKNSNLNPNLTTGTNSMTNLDLGAFSSSLAVKDLAASRTFYEKLGFSKVGGEADQNWLILRNGETTIGLFQDMLPGNVLTFNPGWNSQAEPVDGFTDVREIQKRLKDAGLSLLTEADEATKGPASLMLADPDGNVIMVDQHVD